jgi:hypothetical protein
MRILDRIKEKLFFPPALTGPVIKGAFNIYYRSAADAKDRTSHPLAAESVWARKGRNESWDLYQLRHAPSLARTLNDVSGDVALDEAPHYKKIATGLTLREAFDRVRSHEEQPAERRYGNPFVPGSDRAMTLRQDRPEQDAAYWRNMAAPASSTPNLKTGAAPVPKLFE